MHVRLRQPKAAGSVETFSEKGGRKRKSPLVSAPAPAWQQSDYLQDWGAAPGPALPQQLLGTISLHLLHLPSPETNKAEYCNKKKAAMVFRVRHGVSGEAVMSCRTRTAQPSTTQHSAAHLRLEMLIVPLQGICQVLKQNCVIVRVTQGYKAVMQEEVVVVTVPVRQQYLLTLWNVLPGY